jgi:hydroxyacylglutathione hydrolase
MMMFRRPAVPEITVEELRQRLQAEATMVLDVREPEEYLGGVIPGALRIPLGELSERLQEVPAEPFVACVCAHGQRSQVAAMLLQRAGHTNVASVAGGTEAWKAHGYPVER